MLLSVSKLAFQIALVYKDSHRKKSAYCSLAASKNLANLKFMSFLMLPCMLRHFTVSDHWIFMQQ